MTDFGNSPMSQPASETPAIDRPRMDADIVCVGFGPATAGFLATLSRQLVNADGTPAVESAVAPGLPPQVLCYERADDLGFGVSGVVTKARALRASFPDIDKAGIPMAAPVGEEKVLYLLDPAGREPAFGILLRLADKLIQRLQMGAAFRARGAGICRGRPAFCTSAAAWCFRWDNSCNGLARRCKARARFKSGPAHPSRRR